MVICISGAYEQLIEHLCDDGYTQSHTPIPLIDGPSENMRCLSDDDLNYFDLHSFYHDIVFQVTFIPTSPPMEETRARDFFQERHFSIG